MNECPIPGCGDARPDGLLVCEGHADEIATQVRRRKSVPAHKADGWIYYLLLDGKLKIGWTANLAQRLKSYPPHAVMVLDHPGTRADERDLHRSLAPSRIVGREWYSKTPEVEAALRRVQQMKYEESLAYYRSITDGKPHWIVRTHHVPCMPSPIDWDNPITH